MIRLALLVGSDYTTGLTGIGPVTALEILAAFPSEGDDLLQGLVNFCSWIENGKATGPGKTSLRTKLQNLEIQKGIHVTSLIITSYKIRYCFYLQVFQVKLLFKHIFHQWWTNQKKLSVGVNLILYF